ncbi:MAG: hypothetical protein CMJ46_14165 [Planctomyces sp.]|nr:hypothetical protein [Planctomyces sp.]
MDRPLPGQLGQRPRFRQKLEKSRYSRPRCGFTILELLTVIAILTVLLALLLPSLGSARESARRIQCQNQLKQVGIALQGYHELNRSLPPGLQWEGTGQSAYGWAVPLLDLMEQRAVSDLVHADAPLSDPRNFDALHSSIATFVCPSDITAASFQLFAEEDLAESSAPLMELPTANYLGVFGTIEADNGFPVPKGDGAFLDTQAVRFVEFERGLSNTIIVGERTMSTVPSTWLGVDARGEDAVCRLVGSAITSPNCAECDECEFTSRHPGGVNFLWGDGHVEMVSENIEQELYRILSKRNGYVP